MRAFTDSSPRNPSSATPANPTLTYEVCSVLATVSASDSVTAAAPAARPPSKIQFIAVNGACGPRSKT
jgi:hypothetical protein